MENTDILERIVKVEQSDKSAHHRLDEHETEINELKKTYSIMEKMSYRMENVEKTVEGINEKLDKHDKAISEEANKDDKEKSKKWDNLIHYVFYSIIAVLLGLLYVKLGLK